MDIKRITRYITITAIFLLPILPLIVTTSLVAPFVAGKAFYFRILVEAAFAGWVLLAFLDAKYRPRLTSLTVAVSLFALVTFVTDLSGMNPLRSLWSNFDRMEGWITIIHLWAMYMVFTNVFNANEDGRKLWRRWLNFSLLIATIVAIYGLFQLFGWTSVHRDVGRLDASFGNTSYLAAYMIFHAFIALYLFVVTKTVQVIKTTKKTAGPLPFRWVYLVLVILFALIILETQTRGAILGFVGGMLLALVLYAVLEKNRSKKTKWFTVCVVVLVLIGGVLFWMNRDTPFVQQNSILKRFASISLSTTSSNQTRLYIWPMAIKGAMERPILGWGQDNFNYVYQDHYNPELFGQEQWFDRAHNILLDWLVNAGIVGLLAYLSLPFLFIIYVWKSPISVTEKSILTGLLAGYFVNNLFIFDTLASYFLFFAMLAYVNTFRQGRIMARIGEIPVRKEIVVYVLAPITLVLLIAVIYMCNMRQIVASRTVIAAVGSCGQKEPNIEFFRKAVDANEYMGAQEIREQLYSCMSGIYWNPEVSSGKKQEFVELAKRAISDQVKDNPNDSRGYYFAGAFLDQVGQFGDAEKYLVRAHELSPETQMFDFELAVSYLFQKKNEQALLILKHAYDSSPKFDQVALAYATALELSGKDSEARKISFRDQSLLKVLDTAKSYTDAGQSYKAFVLFQGVVMVAQDANVLLQQAKMEYAQGMTERAIETLRKIGISDPTLKNNIDAAIKQMQK